MNEWQPARAEREVKPKDVFARSNMPSRWERLTNVAPKTAQDRKYLAFVAARYRGDKRLPPPDALEAPREIYTRKSALHAGVPMAAVGVGLSAVGGATHLPLIVVAGVVLVVGALVAVLAVYLSTQQAVSQFYALKSRCERAESRLHADPMDSENTTTINEMIRCDEGTLAYCAAKIASEIEQDSNWRSSRLDILSIDLWEELAEVGASASQITEDRRATDKTRQRSPPRRSRRPSHHRRRQGVDARGPGPAGCPRLHICRLSRRGAAPQHARAARQHCAQSRSSTGGRSAGNAQIALMPATGADDAVDLSTIDASTGDPHRRGS